MGGTTWSTSRAHPGKRGVAPLPAEEVTPASMCAPWQWHPHVCRQLQMMTHSARECKVGRICDVRKCPNAPIWCSFLKALCRFLCVDVLGKHRLNRISGNSHLVLPLCGSVTKTRKMGEATVCIQPQLPQDAKNQKWHLPLALGGPVFSKLWVWLLESSG